MGNQKKKFFNRLVKRVGPEATLRAILRAEAGDKRSDIAKDLGVSGSYLSQVLKEIPCVTLYRIPAELMGTTDDGATDDLGMTRDVRFCSDVEAFEAVWGRPALSSADLLGVDPFLVADQHADLLLNTVHRAMGYIAHQEQNTYEENS